MLKLERFSYTSQDLFPLPSPLPTETEVRMMTMCKDSCESHAGAFDYVKDQQRLAMKLSKELKELVVAQEQRMVLSRMHNTNIFMFITVPPGHLHPVPLLADARSKRINIHA